MNRGTRLVTAGILATGVLTAIGTAPARAAERPFVLTEGHIDLFEVTYSDDTDGLRMQVKDDTGLYDEDTIFREPEDVTVSVDPELAALEIPEGLPPDYEFLGAPGETIYMLPQSQTDGLPWPGWSTERLVSTLPAGVELPTTDDAVSLGVEVDGPGDVHTYMVGATGNVINHYIDSSDGGPDTIPVSRNAHVHTEWVFTETGSYTVTVTPSAETTTGQTLVGPAAEYLIEVGEDADPGDLELAVTPNRPDATYLYGQGITLTAAPSEPTDLDHYHWFIKPAGASEFEISDRSASAELKLPTSLTWNGAQVYASLYDENHEVVASSAPVTLEVTALDPLTTLTATADKPTHEVGDTAQFSSTQDPQTTEDHYHWYLRKTGEEFYTYIPGSDAATASLPITADMDGGQVVARLFNDDHAVIAESAPIALSVDDDSVTQTSITAALTRSRQQYGDSSPAEVDVTVEADGAPTNAGTVTIRVGGRVIGDDVALSAGGTATVTMPRTLAPGTHPVNASFEPTDPTLAPSSSAPVMLRVTKAATVTKAKPAKRKIRQHQRGRLLITVDSALPPTGKVVIRKGSRILARAALNKAGKAAVTLKRLGTGRHRLVVAYAGSSRFDQSSARTTLRVVR